MKKLHDFWKHATTAWKPRVFNAVITSQSAVWLRYYLATERRLEETGRSPSPMVAPNFAHTLCLLQQNH